MNSSGFSVATADNNSKETLSCFLGGGLKICFTWWWWVISYFSPNVSLTFVLYSCCTRDAAFVELIPLDDLLVDVMFLFSTNKKPRKNVHTKERLQNEKTSYRMTSSLKAGGRQEKNLLSFIFERVTK